MAQGIIEKIEAVSIRGNLALWFQNYLQNRKQAVVIKGKKSEYKTVPSGVSHENLYHDGIEMEVVNKYHPISLLNCVGKVLE